MSEFKTSLCRGCGKKIIWGVTPDGKKIPLDAVAPVYHVVGEDACTPTAERASACFVTHFATCPDANRFSRGNKSRHEIAGDGLSDP